MKDLEKALRAFYGRLTAEQLKEQFKADPKEVSALLSFKMENFYPHVQVEEEGWTEEQNDHR